MASERPKHPGSKRVGWALVQAARLHRGRMGDDDLDEFVEASPRSFPSPPEKSQPRDRCNRLVRDGGCYAPDASLKVGADSREASPWMLALDPSSSSA